MASMDDPAQHLEDSAVDPASFLGMSSIVTKE